MPSLGPWEFLIIAVVVILLFGARKMPEMARSLGKSMRILKAETKGMRNDDNDDDEPATPTQAQATTPQQLPQSQQPVQQPQVVQKPVETPQTNANKNVS